MCNYLERAALAACVKVHTTTAGIQTVSLLLPGPHYWVWRGRELIHRLAVEVAMNERTNKRSKDGHPRPVALLFTEPSHENENGRVVVRFGGEPPITVLGRIVPSVSSLNASRVRGATQQVIPEGLIAQ